LLLVPVIVTGIIPEAANVQDKVELPNPFKLVGVIVHDVLLVVRLTSPAKPFSRVTVTVDLATVPAITVTVVGLAEIPKSWNLKVATTKWFSVPLVPVIVTLKLVATAALQDRLAEPEPVTFAGVILPQTRPDGAAMLKVTVPLNPLTAVTVTVELVDWPVFTGAGEEAIIVKS